MLQSYRLGPGDVLQLRVYGESDLSDKLRVDESGMVPLPLVGKYRIEDLTLAEAQTVIENAYRGGYLKSPKLTLEILTFRPFSILGEVRSPGAYTYTGAINLLNAVASAGGFTYRANTKNIEIYRRDEDGNLRRLMAGPATSIFPGDIINIRERLF